MLFLLVAAEDVDPHVPLFWFTPTRVRLPTWIFVLVTLAVAVPVGAMDKKPFAKIPLAKVPMVFAPLPESIRL